MWAEECCVIASLAMLARAALGSVRVECACGEFPAIVIILMKNM
jgi:hypothetical protein